MGESKKDALRVNIDSKLNGLDWNECWIMHEDIITGGTLELEMDDSPNKKWGCVKKWLGLTWKCL